MITHPDEGPDHDPDDPLTVILRPPGAYLGAPPGRYEAIRRGASRRRLLRAAAGAAVTCGVAALALLPLRLAGSGGAGSPAVPLAPPPASSPAAPHRSASPAPRSPRPARDPGTTAPTAVPTTRPSTASGARPSANARVSPSASSGQSVTRAPSGAPSTARTRDTSTPSAATRRSTF
ncbi:hypothetical protein ACIRPX_16295 [Streptomyces sp. NPDC101225]|uniref:hypothetical protein n=1 Tax=Streptomyces sp. NPDC101225 TaxID=3366135 RepID=UPI0038233CDC